MYCRVVSIWLLTLFYHSSDITYSFHLYQCVKLIISSCFTLLISSQTPTPTPHHWLIQFPVIHLFSLISFSIYCTVTSPLIPITLSLLNNIPFKTQQWVVTKDPSLWPWLAALSSFPHPFTSTPAPTQPSGLSFHYSLLSPPHFLFALLWFIYWPLMQLWLLL